MTALRAAIWAAVSTPGQAADDKASIPAQIAAARAEIARRGWREVALYEVPGQSRSITFLADAMADIPAMNSMVVAARHREFDVLVCYAFDRLARTQALLAQLRDYLAQCRVQLYALTAPMEPVAPEAFSPRGSLSSAIVSTMSGLMAEDEVRRFVDRARFGKRAKARRGLYLTRPPYAYRSLGSGLLAIEPERAAVVRRIYTEYLGGYGLLQIGRHLNADGIPSPGGRAWTSSAVYCIITNPAYAGKVRYGYRLRIAAVDPDSGEIVKRLQRSDDPVLADGQHEAIVPWEQWEAAQAERRRRTAMAPRTGQMQGRIHILSGLLRCGPCGGPMHVHYGGPNHDQAAYVCSRHVNGGGCRLNSIPENRAERDVLGALSRIASDPALMAQALAEMPDAIDETPTLQSALADTTARRKRLLDAYERGVLALDAYAERDCELAEQERGLAERLRTTRDVQARSATREERKVRLTALASQDLSTIRPEALKALLRSLIDSITVLDHQVARVSFV